MIKYLPMSSSIKLINYWRDLGYNVVFTFDESNLESTCYCQDCVQFGLQLHNEESL
jgi:hypothetical protein